MGQFGQILFLIENYKVVQISIGLPKRASKNAATERTSFLRER